MGADYEEAALALSTGHAFTIDTLLVLPSVAAEAPDRFRAYVLKHAEPLANDWLSTGQLSILSVNYLNQQ